MGYNNNQFPVFLSMKTDGTLEATLRNFEEFAVGSFGRVSKSATAAGSIAGGAFGFEGSRTEINNLEAGVKRIQAALAKSRTDPLGISGALGGLGSSQVLGNIPAQTAAERKLNAERMANVEAVNKAEASLDAQRQAAHRERVAEIAREANAAIAAIQERRAAQTAAFGTAMAEAERLTALERQRAEEGRKLVVGREFIQAPGFDPQGATAAAAAARAHAQALDQVARAAENVVLQSGRATQTDIAFANGMRDAANAASLEANRLDDLAATQGRVALAAGKLSAGSLDLATSQRGTRQATLQASQQFQDFFIQIQGGQNPMVAFSQQASQLAFVMSGAGGEAGRLAKFIAGGWGTAFFIGLAALTPFVSKLFESDKATKKATEAKELHKKTTEQLIKAIDEENEALGRANSTSLESERASLRAALAKQGEARQRVQNALATLSEAKAEQEYARARATRGGPQGEAVALSLAGNDKEIATARVELEKLAAALATTNVSVGLALAPLTRRRDEERRDPRKKIDGDYERAKTAAMKDYTDDLRKFGLEKATANYSRALDVAGDAQVRANKALDALEEAQRKAAAAANRSAAASEREEARRATYQDFGSPVPGAAITSGFGARRRPRLPGGGFGSAFHGGLDLAKAEGSAVLAPQVATVKSVGFDPGLGKFVILDHGGGTTSRYGHLQADSVTVSEGQRLAKGDPFAKIGSTGRTQGGHLHYEVFEGTKAVDPRKGRFKTDEFQVAERSSNAAEAAATAATRAAEKAQSEQSRLATVAQTASDRVAGITAQFDRQPRLIDQAGKAMRSLDDVTRDAVVAAKDYDALIQKLKNDKPAGFEDQVAALEAAKATLGSIVTDANAARVVVAEGMLRPLEDMVVQSAKQAEIDMLVLEGKEDQADVMREIVALEEQMGPLTETQRAAVEKTVTAQRMMKRALEENEKVIGRAVQSANVLQDALTGVIADPFNPKAWKSGLQSLMADFKNAFAENISRSLFGNLGQEMEDAMRMKADPLGAAGEELNTSALELHRSAIELMRAAGEISKNAARAGPSPEQIGITPSAYMGVDPTGGIGAALGGISSAFRGGPGTMLDLLGKVSTSVGGQAAAANENVSISVSAEDLAKRQLDLQKKSALMADPTTYYNMLGASVGKSVDKVFGSGQVFEKIGGKLGTALQGASIGQQFGGLPALLGMKTSKLGSQLGGAVGGLIGGPIGSILGGIAGSILGGLFKKTKKASASIGADKFGNLDVTKVSGNSDKRERSSTKTADTVIDSLYALGQQLGLALDASKGAVSIGMRGKDIRVDPTGQGRTKGSGVKNFGEDAEAAMEFAIRNLIEDGVLDGIRAGTKKLLVESRLLSRGIEKALKFENVFKRLKEFDDPVGAAIDQLDREFQELRRIFAEAGASAAELADLERLYALDRAEAVKNAAKDATNVLKQLFEDLTFKGDFGLSLRTRRTNAESALAPFQQQIARGEAVDQEGFSEAARALLDVERQLYGSTSQYFETLNMITQLTRMAISAAGGSVSIPGITPTLVRSTTAPSPATLTSPTPGVSAAAPGGTLAIGGPNAVQQAANENYSMGLMIVAAIEKQTATVAPLISQTSIASAIRMAFVTMQQQSAGAGGYGGSSAPGGGGRTASWASELIESNGQVVNKLGELVGFASETADATSRFARTSGDGLPDNHWSKGQMLTPNIYSGSYGGGGGRTASWASDDPVSRLSTSVSGF